MKYLFMLLLLIILSTFTTGCKCCQFIESGDPDQPFASYHGG